MRLLYFLTGIFVLALCLIGCICYLILTVEVDSPQKSDLIFPLSWSKTRLAKTVELVNSGYSDRILASTPGSYKELTVTLDNEKVEILFRDAAKSTFDEALLLKDLTEATELKTVILVSDYVHLYRAKWCVHRVLASKPVSVFYVPAEAGQEVSLKMLAQEITKVTYYWLWYGVCGRTNHLAWTDAVKEKLTEFTRKYL